VKLKLLGDLPDPYKTVGDEWLCAWATSENTCRVQTNDPVVAKRLAKLPDIEQVGYSVTAKFLRAFATPYTLAWVEKNIVQKITLKFPKKDEGGNCKLPAHAHENENLHLEAVAV
jgi:hypothetical protein